MWGGPCWFRAPLVTESATALARSCSGVRAELCVRCRGRIAFPCDFASRVKVEIQRCERDSGRDAVGCQAWGRRPASQSASSRDRTDQAQSPFACLHTELSGKGETPFGLFICVMFPISWWPMSAVQISFPCGWSVTSWATELRMIFHKLFGGLRAFLISKLSE